MVFYENPLLTFDRIVKCLLATAREGHEPWAKGAPLQLSVKMRFAEAARRALGPDVPVLYSAHHVSHAASAFYPSPFDRAAVLIMDGVGEWTTTSLGVGDAAGLRLDQEIRYPHSLGLLWAWGSTAWPTACSCVQVWSTSCGSSPQPVTPAAR